MSGDSLLRAITERVFFIKGPDGDYIPTPKPQKDIFSTRLSKFRGLLLHYMPSTATKLTEKQFLANYDGRKRGVYERAARVAKSKPFDRREAVIVSFVKVEKTDFTEKDKVPRVISPRSPVFNFRLGLYTKGIEHDIYRSIDNLFNGVGRVVAKGMNMQERGLTIEAKWSSFADPIAVGLDASRFDQHVSVDALKFEHSVYLGAYRGDKHLRDLLTCQLRARAISNTSDGARIRYEYEGTRASGDMNTALGNVLLMCGMMYSYFETLGFRVEFMNDGDDCVVIMERRNQEEFLKDVKNFFLELGFTMKVEDVVDELEMIEFCQAKPVWTTEGYRMVRDPKIAIPKDGSSFKRITCKDEYNYYRGMIASCGLALAGDLPIYHTFYRSLAAGVELVDAPCDRSDWSGVHYLALRMKHKDATVDWRSRVSFWRAFGITPDRQRALENVWARTTVAWEEPRPLGIKQLTIKNYF
jgi:hypothetical protein